MVGPAVSYINVRQQPLCLEKSSYTPIFLFDKRTQKMYIVYMKIEQENDWWFKRWWLPIAGESKRSKRRGCFANPVTPARKWQIAYAKVRRVKVSERGSGVQAIRSHTRYLAHKDGHEHKDRLVCEVGDVRDMRNWPDQAPHYRVIVAPERGDVLDMERAARNILKEVANIYGAFAYYGAIHEKLQSNGRLNKHIHLIFKDTLGKGANALKGAFYRAMVREATLQFEERGLHYIHDPLDRLLKRDLERELRMGDYD